MYQSILVRVTHGQPAAVAPLPAITTSILIDDIFDPTHPSTRNGFYVPYGTLGTPGSIVVPLTSAVTRSLEQGCLAGHISKGNVIVAFEVGAPLGDAFSQNTRVPYAVSPNNTIIDICWIPRNCKLLGVQAYLEQSATTAGTYTFALEKGPDSNLVNLLSSPTFDLKTLTSQVVGDIPITSTSSDLYLPANTRLKLTVSSNNLDLVAGGLVFLISYGLR